MRNRDRVRTVRLYDPERETLDDEPLVIGEATGFASWTPQQWALFFGAAATFIAAVVNILAGNPGGIPFSG